MLTPCDLCVGEEEAAPVTGNSHVSVPAPIADNTPNKHDDALENHKPAPASESHKKEKSVLQAKLTKLAIQIGYAGNCVCSSSKWSTLSNTL